MMYCRSLLWQLSLNPLTRAQKQRREGGTGGAEAQNVLLRALGGTWCLGLRD